MTKIPYQQASDQVGRDHGDLSGSLMPVDLLRTIFQGQTMLMAKYEDQERRNGEFMPSEADWGDLNSRTVQMRLHSLYGYMIREMSEAMTHLDAKPWKDNPRITDEAAFREEIADTLHFFIEFCIVSGVGAAGLFHEYFRAWEKNNVRQASAY